MSNKLPVCKKMCGSCPFRGGSKYAELTPMLIEDAIHNNSRICHSTGTNALNGETGKPDLICRGARDVQLQVFAAQGFIDAPTDEAWDRKAEEMGIT